MAEIREKEDLRNRTRVFRDRIDAGKLLGRMLQPALGENRDLFILCIPMGGVPVALEIAKILKRPLDLVIVRKIQIPGNTEAGFGAMTSEGDVFLNEPLMARLSLNDSQVERQTAKTKEEIEKRARRLRGERPFPKLEGKTVLLVDDGLASGFTMKATISVVKKRNAASIVVAAPTAPLRTIGMLADETDAIYCPNIREGLSFAVADAYQNWYDLSEPEVRRLLSDYEIEKSG